MCIVQRIYFLFIIFMTLNSKSTAAPAHAAVPESRIIGGSKVDILKYPYEVSIRRRFCGNCNYEHYCSGIIYRSNIVVTTANCVGGSKANTMTMYIVAGSSWRAGAAQDGHVYPIASVTTHENPNIDLALVHLDVGIVLNNITTSVVSLAKESPRAGKMALVAGWGQQQESDVASEKLRELRVPIVAQQQCAQYYKAWRAVSDFELCAGYETGAVDTCQGDAGSPLLVDGQVVGLVSWGFGCARPRYPGVYTNLVALRAWIEQNA